MAEPSQNVINGLHARLGKLVEVGTVYTMVAGLLNVLAIYDAYDGPAYADDESSEPGPAAEPPRGRAGSRRRAGVTFAADQHLLVRPAPGRRDQPGLFGLPARGLGPDLGARRCGSAA